MVDKTLHSHALSENSGMELFFGILMGLVVGTAVTWLITWKRRGAIVEVKDASKDEPVIPPYLANNSWEQELNLKLWTTKGARFQADKRNSELGRLSQTSTAFLTAYVIVLSLMPYFLRARLATEMGDIVNYTGTAVSIVLLAYSLLQSFREHNLRARMFHECGLSLSKLYNQLRQAKSMEEETKQKELRNISDEYEDVLSRYDNHENIDFEVFQTLKPKYFLLTKWRCRWIHTKYFCKVRLLHYFIMSTPPLLIGWLLLWSFNHKS